MRKILYTIMSVICLFALASCAEGDGDKLYGVEKVYIPQSMADGGITNIYNVPSGDGEYTYNFSIEDETVEVFLGVLRSGKQAGEAFTVDVVVNNETTAAQATALAAEVMSSDLYTLPSNVKVEAGTNQTRFNLSLNKAALKAKAGKKLVLCIALANPSKYELSEAAAEVTVLVDVDALKL
ncbi:MAG: DUF1735 domain-containing protein [Bacteroidales bacterium]|nr:DUF1735 domain-containing protein [Bacteroidales bacterium]